MKINKKISIYRCDLCGEDIPWGGNERSQDAKDKDCGIFHYCDDCYLTMIAKGAIESQAVERGRSPLSIAEAILRHYEDQPPEDSAAAR